MKTAQPPLKNKLLYASSSLGSNLLFQALSAWLVFFYAAPAEPGKSILIPVGLVGLLLGIAAQLKPLMIL